MLDAAFVLDLEKGIKESRLRPPDAAAIASQRSLARAEFGPSSSSSIRGSVVTEKSANLTLEAQAGRHHLEAALFLPPKRGLRLGRFLRRRSSRSANLGSY